jgi:hypothetical protein
LTVPDPLQVVEAAHVRAGDAIRRLDGPGEHVTIASVAWASGISRCPRCGRGLGRQPTPGWR